MRTLARWLALAAAALPLTSQAFCGFFAGKADASLFNEASQVAIVRDGQRTVLSLLNDYKGPLNEFALIVPTPTTLQQGQVRVAEKAVFERLDAYSAPRLAEYHDPDPCQFHFSWGQLMQPVPAPAAMASTMVRREAEERAQDKALGVTVDVQYTLEEYDIVSLSATQSDGLETWLHTNGYTVPKGASAALRPYINQGMKFFVAKVNLKEQAKTGYTYLRPLQFAFESEKFMLPLRLGMLNAAPGQAQDLIVFALTRQGRVESSNYRTAKLPANVDLPFYVKPRFKEFYQSLFDQAAQKEDHRVVFTEYFWDMGWCDPCADNPLTTEELRKTGVFWVGGDADEGFAALTRAGSTPAKVAVPRHRVAPMPGAQPVVLTRLHVRYTPNTFPEDLMFTQTKDRQNWQTRYVIHNPHPGTAALCEAKLDGNSCAQLCRERVAGLKQLTGRGGLPIEYRGREPAVLQRDCEAACAAGKREAVQRADQYYTQTLPNRLAKEKQTLAQLTGWSMVHIDAMPDAQTVPGAPLQIGPPASAPAAQPWWQRLFGSRS